MLSGIIIIIIFLIMAFLMITKRMPTLLALPFMAILIGITAGIASYLNAKSLSGFIFNTIITEGSVYLAQAMMYSVFGAILSQIVLKTGIAEKIVKTAAELGGDKKIFLALFLVLAAAITFTSLTGLGAVIMVGTLILPIMMGSGLSPLLSSSLLLFAISLGGIFNAANWGFYSDALKINLEVIRQFSLSYGIILAIITLIFILIEAKKENTRFNWSIEIPAPKIQIPAISLLTPLIPVLLILLPYTKWPIIPAFITAILFGAITTNPKKIIPTLTAAIIEGLKDIAPVIGLFIGIGMVLNSVRDPLTAKIMEPFIKAIIPKGYIGYGLFFGLLAPLALYRGPLNLFGLGSGFAALLLGINIFSPVAIMGAFLATGQIQGICDPTNTHNIWIAQFSKITPEDLLKKTLFYIWAFVFIALTYSILRSGLI
ncbi:MAG: transporter [Armatimonadetes bacterium]|nr:transporter [Armatimonadota bacterium]